MSYAASVARALIAPLPDAGVIVVDAELHLELITGDVFRRRGWDTGEGVGRHLSDVMAADGWHRLRRSYEAALAGRRLSFTHRASEDGRDYLIEMSPIGDDPVIGVLALIQDVTSVREQRRHERHMTTAVNSLQDGVVTVSLEERVIDANPAACALLDRDLEQLQKPDWFAHLQPRDADDQPIGPQNNPGHQVAMTGQALRDVDMTIVTQDGRRRPIRADYHPLVTTEGQIDGLVVTIRDRTEASELKASQRALLAQVDRVFDGSPTGMVIMSSKGVFQRVNPSMCRLLGRSDEELVGMNWRDIIHPDDKQITIDGADRMTTGDQITLAGPRRYLRADGSVGTVMMAVTAVPGHGPGDEIGGFFGEFQDLTVVMEAQRARSRVVDSALDAIVTIDADGHITEFNPAAEQMFGRSRVDVLGVDVAAAIIPPEYRNGHRKALRALVEGADPRILGQRRELQAQRADGSSFPIELTITQMSEAPPGYTAFIRDLSDAKRAEQLLAATIAGLGEGVLVVDEADRLVLVNEAAEQITGWGAGELLGRRVAQTLRVEGTDDVMRRKDGTTFPAALSVSEVDVGDGRQSVVVSFRDITEEKAEEERLRADLGRLEMLTAIYEALEDDRFVLHAQPIADLRSRQMVSEELLLRMVARDGTLIPPGDFLPVAETHEVMLEIDRWVIRRAASLAAGGRSVAVNLSGRSVGSDAVLETIEEALRMTRADPRRLTFEITETTVAGDLGAATRFAQRLVALGCGFALDDFGTGYGTLTYLKSLPVSYIKIDLEFVRDLTTSEQSRKVVEVMVGMGKTFGLKTIAEGVEDRETLILLGELGVDCAQGFLLGRPGPV